MEHNLRRNRVDRITNLPIHLQQLIISQLSAQEMVQTSLLSKHWTNIWRSVPHLHFFDFWPEDRIKNHNFVVSLLLLRDGESKIQDFRLKMGILKDEIGKANAWISYALKHNVEVLHLHINIEDGLIKHINPSIFACQSLRELSLEINELDLPACLCLPALRVLELHGFTTIRNEQIFSGLHSLETLILGDRCRIKCATLNISLTRLKSLKMNLRLKSSLFISAPNLVSLELNIFQKQEGTIGFYSDMVHLNDAKVNIADVCSEAAVQIISMIKNARSLLLTVSYDYVSDIIRDLQNKDFATRNRIQFQFSNLKLLSIETMLNHGEFVLISNILNYSPQLESFFLINMGDDSETTEAICCQDPWSKHELSNLKLVEVHGFGGTKIEVKMVEFFLENAIVLENLIILTANAEDQYVLPEEELMMIGRKILTYPRASSSVGLLFSPMDEKTFREDDYIFDF